MKSINLYLLSAFIIFFSFAGAQQKEDKKQQGHYNTNKFRQLKEELPTPNVYRTASGAPGPEYYQQRADYDMEVTLDDANEKLYGWEKITYHNNSPDDLNYLWVQLDQNIRAKDSKSPDIQPSGLNLIQDPGNFSKTYLEQPFDGGFHIAYVKDDRGRPLPYTINRTMMRIDLKKPLKKGDKFTFQIKWWYPINNHVVNRARSGFEHFPEDGNNLYVIAQFYPRMAVYDDVEGWQNLQFWGRGEFALPFGDFHVKITTPADHILEATGELQNRKKVLTKTQYNRYQQATKSFDKPVVIVTQEEAEKAEKGFSDKKKTWEFRANNVRDFAFASSRKFIWDAQAVKIGDKTVMAESLYPKEGNPLWEEYSTKTVAHTLKSYSKHTFDYPYPKAVSVHSKNQGMEYPMICWNYGRPAKDGTYSDRTKYGMISVIIHEVGHNFFPMIVNSDERQWTWMDEGLNTFVQFLTEQTFQKDYPSRRGHPKDIVFYMSGNQEEMAPIMTQSNNIYHFGSNAYSKPATALNILRETILGPKLFDYAFKTYAQRWKFKHPTPADFFRTMEDASATDLDWFWRGWFYTTDYNDIGIKNVKKYYLSLQPGEKAKKMAKERGMPMSRLQSLLHFVEETDSAYREDMKKGTAYDSSKYLNKYLSEKFSPEERKQLKKPVYFYEITFEKPGGLVMPIIMDIIYADGSKERKYYPAQIWRKNDKEVKKVISSDKQIVNFIVDPGLETADINLNNNFWPKKKEPSRFEKFKGQLKK